MGCHFVFDKMAEIRKSTSEARKTVRWTVLVLVCVPTGGSPSGESLLLRTKSTPFGVLFSFENADQDRSVRVDYKEFLRENRADLQLVTDPSI